MRRLLFKLVLLALPFVFYALGVFAVDPFDYFRVSSDLENAFKSAVGGRLDPPLWKLLAYRRSPRAHILLGDSRMNSLDAEQVGAKIGEPVANLAYGGGSLNEAIRTFWIAVDRVPLKSVTIGVNLDTYNDSNMKDRVSPAQAVMNSPALYLCNRVVALGLWYSIRHAMTGWMPDIGRPPMAHDAFWRYQLDVTAKRFYSGYRKPVSYRARLAEVRDECKRRRIKLTFVIFPEHTELMAVARRIGLEPAADAMRNELSTIGSTIDFSRREDWTNDRSLFVDPFHFAPPVAAKIIEQVWSAVDSPIPASR